MKSNLVTLDERLISSEIVELSDSLKKKLNHVNQCNFYKDMTRKCYFQSIFCRKNKYHYILNESKKLSDLCSDVDIENNARYIDIIMSNCEHNNVLSSVHGENCPESRKLPVGMKTNMGIILAKTASSNWYYVKHEVDKYNPNTRKYEPCGKYDYIAVHWHNVFDTSKCSKERMNFEDNFIRYSNTTIETILGKEWHFGVDRSPFYQRGDVWTAEQQEALIDSLFNQIPIGAIIFARKDFKVDANGNIDRMDEIVDGKQRYTTIIDFVCDKFKYRGKYYSELHPFDRNRFCSSNIMIGEIMFSRCGGKYDEKEVLKTFIRLNVGGTSMDNNLIESARKRLEKFND